MQSKAIILVLLWVLLKDDSIAQPYSLNSSNGLPSNHVYYTLKDKYGYLWIATDKGVVKYNGYDTKVFTVSQGLVNDDVWFLYEDKKGRIWLSSIDDDIGYIYEDEFHLAKKTQKSRYLRPASFGENKIGIFFSVIKSLYNDIFFESNDSLYPLSLVFPKSGYYVYDPSSGIVFRISERGLEKLIFGHDKITTRIINRHISNARLRNTKSSARGSYLLIQEQQGVLTIIALLTGKEYKINLHNHPGENIIMSYFDEEGLKVVTNLRIIFYNPDFEQAEIYKNYNRTLTISDDKFWGLLAATRDTGVMFYGTPDLFQSNGYKQTPRNNTHIYETQAIQLFAPESPMSKYRSIRFSTNGIYLKDSNGKTVSYLKQHLFSISLYKKQPPERINNYVQQKAFAHCLAWNRVFFLTPGGGLFTMKNHYDSTFFVQISDRKYMGLFYEPMYGALVAYGKNEIFITKKTFSTSINRTQLRQLNINKIDKIIPDSNGNIFLKDQDKLFRYNIPEKYFTPVLTQWNLKDALITMHNGRLFIAGKAGFLGYVIKGKYLSPFFEYINTRKANYNTVNNLFVADSTAYLKTDKGDFSFKIPDTGALKGTEYHYRINIYNTERQYNVSNGDTIEVPYTDQLLMVDFINPKGAGKLLVTYTLNNQSEHAATDKKIDLRNLEAGKYYKLVITCEDEVRRFQFHYTLFLVPQWWQTHAGKLVLTISIGFIILLLIFATALLTRRIIKRQHIKRLKLLELNNARLSTELKTIYAQINPHFIFNTLSTTTFFIKKSKNREAIEHIISFSKLLRSYIKSSREKFITIEEEMNNISNYVRLQQTRFENKFRYELILSESREIKDMLIPAFLIQPLVENAINHGLIHSEHEGLLKIIIGPGNIAGEIVCIIDDNGIGRQASREYYQNNNIKRESFGTDLTAELIATVNAAGKIFINIDYKDKVAPLSGTIVTLTITQL